MMVGTIWNLSQLFFLFFSGAKKGCFLGGILFATIGPFSFCYLKTMCIRWRWCFLNGTKLCVFCGSKPNHVKVCRCTCSGAGSFLVSSEAGSAQHTSEQTLKEVETRALHGGWFLDSEVSSNLGTRPWRTNLEVSTSKNLHLHREGPCRFCSI